MQGIHIPRGRRHRAASAAGADRRNDFGMHDFHSANLGDDILVLEKAKEHYTEMICRRGHGGL